VERLLLRGIPAILVDRKGDLCGYAEPGPWPESSDDPEAAGRRRRLRARVDVALYTPGNPNGQPLSIAVAPRCRGRLPVFVREQAAKPAAAALAGMMNYAAKGADQSRTAVLVKAIDLLSQLEPDGAVAIDDLIRYVHDADTALVHAIGHLD